MVNKKIAQHLVLGTLLIHVQGHFKYPKPSKHFVQLKYQGSVKFGHFVTRLHRRAQSSCITRNVTERNRLFYERSFKKTELMTSLRL